MSLTSLEFFIFFGISLVIYYVIPKRFQWIALLIFSAGFFVLSGTWYTLIYLIACAFVTFIFGRYIGKFILEENSKKAKQTLLLGIILNLLMLIVLKYGAFFVENINALLSAFGAGAIPVPAFDMPMGISFYTLTAIGYLLDVYWKISEFQKNGFKTGLFIGYFPLLTSGPIVRYGQLGTGLFEKHAFDYKQLLFGLSRMLWGVFKKLVISSRLGTVVDTIYADTGTYNGAYIWLAAALFMLQLYTDFSGCMDIIIGASKCYGIELPENFKTPFFSRSVQEYWQRWHITLGAWLKDYILYPILRSSAWRRLTKWTKKHLGKKAARQLPSYLGMLCVWLLIGAWHGANWKYILGMGLWFWLCIMLSQLLAPFFKKVTLKLHIKTESFLWRLFQSLRVFVLVSVGNMFFRLDSIGEVFNAIGAGFSAWNPNVLVDGSLLNLGLSAADGIVLIAGLVLLLVVSAVSEKKGSVIELLSKKNIALRCALLMALLFAVILLGTWGQGYDAASFIYANF